MTAAYRPDTVVTMITWLGGIDRRWMASALVAGLVAAAIPAYAAYRAHTQFPDVGLLRADPHELDDGYHHVVVAFDGTTPASSPAAADPPAATPTPTPAPPTTGGTRVEVPVPEENGHISAEALDTLRGQGRIVEVARRADGRLVAVVEGGVAPAAPGAPPATTTAPATGDPNDAPDQLRSVPGTRAVEPVAPGVYAVTTSADPDAYRALPGVASIERDAVATISATNDPAWTSQWHLENTGQRLGNDQLQGTPGTDLGVEDAWKVGDGAGRVVAVIDTGVDTSHPDLQGSFWRNSDEICGNRVDDDANGYTDDCAGWDFLNNDGDVRSTGSADDRHATHISGMIAARTGNGTGVAGIAPGARIMPLKISDNGSMWMSDAARALRYAADNGADIVNGSFGGPGSTPSFDAAVDYARSRGVLVVVAAGNDARNIDVTPTYPASLPYDNILTVAASTAEDKQASFSNWGPVSVDVHAPGKTILSTMPGGGYAFMDGTSMATPGVAASAAVIWSVHPELDATGVKALLMSKSPSMAAFTGKTVSGRRVDLGAIVNPGGDGVTFRVDGLATARPDAPFDLAVQARVPASTVPAGGQARYRARLFTHTGGQLYGVVGLPVTTAAGPTATDDDATVELGDGSAPTATLPLTLGLPAGQYALVTEAYETGTGERIGRAAATYFTVPTTAPAVTTPPPAEPTTKAPAPTTTTRPGSGPAPTTTRSGAPTTKAPSGGSGPAPTTARPGGPSPTSPAPAPTSPAPNAPAPGPGTPPTTRPAGPAPTAPPPTTPKPTSPQPTTAPTTRAGGTPPTVPPTTKAPPSPATAPTTASPPATTRPSSPPPTAPPLPPATPPVTGNGITVRSVSPRYGSTAGGEQIQITGSGFSGNLYVRIGGSSASGSALSPTLLVVTTPAHTAGPVDIEVGRIGGGSVVYRKGYEYRAPGPGTGTVPVPGQPLPTPPTTGAPVPTTAPSGNPGAPGPTTVPGAPAPTTTRAPSGGVPTAPADPSFAFGPERTMGGLRLRPVTGGPALAPVDTWGARSCNRSSCDADPI